jgi:hypothetical protein
VLGIPFAVQYVQRFTGPIKLSLSPHVKHATNTMLSACRLQLHEIAKCSLVPY